MIQVADLNQYIAMNHVRTAAGDYSAIVRLLILLGGRYSEIAELRWDKEVNLDKGTLHIKGEGTLEHRGTKNKHDLVLPLPPMAVTIFREIKRRPGREFVFGDSKRGMGNNNDLKKTWTRSSPRWKARRCSRGVTMTFSTRSRPR